MVGRDAPGLARARCAVFTFFEEPGLLPVRTICMMSSKFQRSIAGSIASLRDPAAGPEVRKCRAYWPCLTLICHVHLFACVC